MKRMRVDTVCRGIMGALLAALFACGCDDGPISDPASVGHGLLGEETAVSEEANETEEVGTEDGEWGPAQEAPADSEWPDTEEVECHSAPEVPDESARLRWHVSSGDEAEVVQETLRLRIENLIPYDISVQVSVEFLGLLGKRASLDLGIHEVQAEGEIELAVPAAGIPVQSTDHFSQAVANAVVVGAGGEQSMAPAVGVFYRHGAGYQGVFAYTEEDIREQFGGRLVDLGATLQAEGIQAALDTVIGRVLEDDGFPR